MNHLLRDLAPFGDDAWAMLDDEARDRLSTALSARKLVDFDGPHGWKHSAVDVGRTDAIDTGAAGAGRLTAKRRRVLPLSEVRADFRLRFDELVDFSRGATDIDLGPLDEAALRLAGFENRAVFAGWDAAGIAGVGGASPHPLLHHDRTSSSFRAAVTDAVAALRSAGVGGPYALAAGPADWTEIVESDDDGYPLRRHLEAILGGSVEWTPGIDGSVVVSTRGGDFALTVGEDLSLGYSHHDAEGIGLYLEESFAFRVNTPEAAVAIVGER